MAGGTTRSAAIDSGVVKSLCGLTDDQITTLRDTYSITHVTDLVLLDKDDVDAILGTSTNTFMKRRKLTAVTQYVKYGGVLTASTTLAEMTRAISLVSTGTASSSTSA